MSALSYVLGWDWEIYFLPEIATEMMAIKKGGDGEVMTMAVVMVMTMAVVMVMVMNDSHILMTF